MRTTRFALLASFVMVSGAAAQQPDNATVTISVTVSSAATTAPDTVPAGTASFDRLKHATERNSGWALAPAEAVPVPARGELAIRCARAVCGFDGGAGESPAKPVRVVLPDL